MNLNNLYKPIGRLYEEVPSADYRGDYLAANGGWNNVVEDDPAVKAYLDAIQRLINQRDAFKKELTDLTTGTQDCIYQEFVPYFFERGYYCKNLKLEYGTRKVTSGKYKNWTFTAYDSWTKFKGRIEDTLPNTIANLDKEIKDTQAKAQLQIGIKGQSVGQSQETKSKTIDLEKAKTEAEAKKKVEESKQKQTDAELRAKKIFLSIIASALILSAAGFALLRK